METLIAYLKDTLITLLGQPWLVTMILAALPIVEARLAVPLAFSFGENGFACFLQAFVGSSLPAPLLLAFLLPLIRLLKNTKFFGKISSSVLDKVDQKAQKLVLTPQKKASVGDFCFRSHSSPLYRRLDGMRHRISYWHTVSHRTTGDCWRQSRSHRFSYGFVFTF